MVGIRLRSLLIVIGATILVASLAVASLILIPTTVRQVRQREAIRDLARRGAIFNYRSPQARDAMDVSQLKVVSLDDVQNVTPQDVECLLDMRVIPTLSLAGPQWDDGLLARIVAGQRRLAVERLYLMNTLTTPVGARSIASLSGLKHLCLIGRNIDDAFVSALGGAQRLESITLLRCAVSLDSLDVRQFPALKTLDIYYCANVTEDRLDAAIDGSNLVRLALISLECSLDGVIQNCTIGDLRYLEIRHCSFTDAGAEGLANYQNLVGLTIVGTSVGARGCKAISQLGTVNELTLAGPHIDDVCVREVSAMEQLERLDLRGSEVSDASVEYLCMLRQLHELRLPAQISDSALEQLRKCLTMCQIKRQ